MTPKSETLIAMAKPLPRGQAMDAPAIVHAEPRLSLPLGELTGLCQMIRTALPEQASRIVQFSSAHAGEGAAHIAFEFAVAASRHLGLRVLYIDTHAPRQGPRKALADAVKTPLSALLRQGGAFGGAQAAVANMPLSYALLHGSDRSDAATAASEEVRELLDMLRGSHDLIVIAYPAVVTHITGALFSRFADGTVLVVEAERTRAPVVSQARHLIEANGGRVIGAVLNKRRLYIPRWLYNRL